METPTFSKHTDPEGWETVTVDKWPDTIQLSMKIFESWATASLKAHAYGMELDKDLLHMWCLNGKATYKVVAVNFAYATWRCEKIEGCLNDAASRG